MVPFFEADASIGDSNAVRILIAEDDVALAQQMRDALIAPTVLVERVTDGAQADTALYAAEQYDLLVLDLGLPRLHGLDVLTRLRARGSSLPVLILTAAGCTGHCDNGLELGADACLAKPFALADLVTRVRALMRLRGLLVEEVEAGVGHR